MAACRPSIKQPQRLRLPQGQPEQALDAQAELDRRVREGPLAPALARRLGQPQRQCPPRLQRRVVGLPVLRAVRAVLCPPLLCFAHGKAIELCAHHLRGSRPCWPGPTTWARGIWQPAACGGRSMPGSGSRLRRRSAAGTRPVAGCYPAWCRACAGLYQRRFPTPTCGAIPRLALARCTAVCPTPKILAKSPSLIVPSSATASSVQTFFSDLLC